MIVPFPLSNVTIAGHEVPDCPTDGGLQILDRLIIYAQGEQIPHLYGPLHAK